MKLNSIDVLILCGGLGTRLRSVIGESPKPMAEFDHEPFLNVLLKDLREQGFQRIILCAGYKGDVIEEYYRGHDLGLEIIVSQELSPLGTGGAIQNVRHLIQSKTFLVLNGDSFCHLDYAEFLKFHDQKKAVASMAVVKAKGSKDYGMPALDRTKKVIGFFEKTEVKIPAKDSTVGVNAGIYCFNEEIFAFFPGKDVFSLENDMFSKLVNKEFFGFEIKEGFIDIGTPERFKKAQTFLKKEQE